ncbi:ACP S-malonyltransferase [Aerococcaceae bacterium WGS1372]
MKLAVIFNGQGAHYEDMGMDFVESFQQALTVFEEAEDATQLPIKMWIQSDINQLSLTKNAQPAIVTTSLAIFESIKTKLPAIAYMAGLSLGEYSSLIASRALSFRQGIQLIQQRGELMSAYCSKLEDEASYQMAAAINMPLEEIKELVPEIVNDINQPLFIANYNSPSQIVIAGDKEAIKNFRQKAKALGYRKIIPLKVEGPFHTPLMNGVVDQFTQVLEMTEFQEPDVPVISNVTVEDHQLDTIKERLAEHLVQPVKWYQTIDRLKEEGITHILQIGPGNTLAKLMKNDDSMSVHVIDTVEDINNLDEWIQSGGEA